MLANLKAAIAARGLRQLDLCFEFKIDAPTLSGIVRGYKQAGPELRRKIAARLEADEAWLFTPARIVPPRHAAHGSAVHAGV